MESPLIGPRPLDGLRTIFMGTPDFAVPTLCALHEAGHEIALVVAQPDAPAGRNWATLTALEGSPSALEEMFTDEDLMDFADAVAFAESTEGPVLLEFVVEMEEAVFPMVPAGADLDAMIRRPIRRDTANGD